MAQYDTIYLGYPIWYGDLPMAVYTFLESYNWKGKTIIPFCTHEGSGLSGTPATIKETVGKGVTIKKGLAMLPLNLTMEEFDEHEYYSELSKNPAVASKKTSKIKAGHIYYWDGWNAFVINYKDTDISPYKVVHVGEIKDKSVVDVLEKSGETLSVKVRAK